VNTPPYNIFTMKKAVMEHGFYDDDGEKDDIRSRLETARG
jgi:hypothetical protein